MMISRWADALKRQFYMCHSLLKWTIMGFKEFLRYLANHKHSLTSLSLAIIGIVVATYNRDYDELMHGLLKALNFQYKTPRQ